MTGLAACRRKDRHNLHVSASAFRADGRSPCVRNSCPCRSGVAYRLSWFAACHVAGFGQCGANFNRRTLTNIPEQSRRLGKALGKLSRRDESSHPSPAPLAPTERFGHPALGSERPYSPAAKGLKHLISLLPRHTLPQTATFTQNPVLLPRSRMYGRSCE